MSHTITLESPQQAHEVWTRAWQWVKGRTLQGRRVTLTLQDETRSLEQNALLHALLTEIARTNEWAGKRRDVDTWKRLFVAAWSRAKGESVEVLPALDGHGVDIVFRRTSRMSKAEVSDLIEYVSAWKESQ